MEQSNSTESTIEQTSDKTGGFPAGTLSTISGTENKAVVLRRLAKQALQVQDACNMSGLAQTFARVMLELGTLGIVGHERNRHPITQAWVSKMHDLAGVPSGGLDTFKMFEACEELAKE